MMELRINMDAWLIVSQLMFTVDAYLVMVNQLELELKSWK
jgi:hypothetical protein